MKYCTAGRKGLKLALIADVSLGAIKEYSEMAPDLVAPPEGYDSVHGVRSTEWRYFNCQSNHVSSSNHFLVCTCVHCFVV
jgi:hypothetical protein